VATAFALVTHSRDKAVRLAKDNGDLATRNGDLATRNGKLAEDNGKLAEDNQKKAQQERELRQKVQRQSASASLTEGVNSCERGDCGPGLLRLTSGLELAHQAEAADVAQACRTQLDLWGARVPSLKMLLPHADEVLAVAFSPDGGRILTGGADRAATLWDATTGQPIGEPLRPGARPGPAPDPGGPGIGSPRPANNAPLLFQAEPNHRGEVVAVAFSPDGRTLAVGTGDPYYRGRSHLLGAGELLRPGLGLDPGRSTLRPHGFSPDPQPGATYVRRAPLWLWDATTGKALDPFPHSWITWATAFSPDGRMLLTGGGPYQKDRPTGRTIRHDLTRNLEGAYARLWDAVKGDSLRWFPHDNAVLAVAFSPDGRRILTGSADRTARLWDVGTGRLLGKPLEHDGLVLAVAFSPDGRTLVTCSQSSATRGTVRLWNAGTGQPLGEPLPHPRPVLAAAFSPDGRVLLTGSSDPASSKGEAHLWAVATGRPLGEPLPHPGPVHAVAWSPDGRRVVTGCADKVARVWEARPTPAVAQVAHHERVIAYSPDGRRVLLGATPQAGPRCEWVSVGEPAPGQSPVPMPPGAGETTLAAFSPDGRKVVLVAEDGLRLVDTTDGRLIGEVMKPGGAVEAVAFSPDGHAILVGTSQSFEDKGEATLWDAATAQLLRTLNCAGPVLSVAFSPDGRTAATGGGTPATTQGEAQLWEAATGRPLGSLVHRGPVRAVLFGPDGRTLATASEDGTARLWDVASGQPRGEALAHHAPVRALAFGADGGLLLTGSDDQTAQLWNTATGQAVGAALAHRGSVRAVAVSGDGRLLATGGDDGTARLWEAATGRPVEDPLVHQGRVVSVAFCGDGRTLLTRSTATNTTRSRRIGGAWETTVGSAAQSTGWVWALPAPVADEPAAVLLRVQVATGLELDAESRVRVLDAADWRERRGRLGDHGDPAPSAQALRAWHRREARAAEAAGEWFAAQWHLERLGEDEPASEDLHARRGRAYANANRWEQAVPDLSRALASSPLREDLRYLRGLAFRALNQDDKALADFSEAISFEENKRISKRPSATDAWVLWFQRGQTYFRLRQMDKAIADFSQVLSLNPNHGVTWHGRGMAYAEQGDLERAAVDFAAALEHAGTPARAWCDHAQARLQLGDAAGYRASCARALQRFGQTQDPGLAALVAWTCCLAPGATADPKPVVQLAGRALDLDGDGYQYQRAWGAALYRAGKFQEAVVQLTHAAEMRKQPVPATWLFLALAHQRLKHDEEARTWLDKARAWVDQARRQKPGGGPDEKALSWDKLPWNERLALTVLRREAEALLAESEDD
jgi:WD40 repeat protein/tetratricopeptide (TPR) repeat protein